MFCLKKIDLKTRGCKAQTSVEYLMLIAGALALLVLIVVLFKGNIFNPSETKIVDQSDEIHGNISSVKCGPTPVAGCPDGSEHECVNFEWVCPQTP